MVKKVIWFLLLSQFAFMALLGGGQFVLGYEITKELLDHLSRDGNLALYNLQVYRGAVIPGLIVGVVSLLIGVFMLLKRESVQTWVDKSLEKTGNFIRAFRADAKVFWWDFFKTLSGNWYETLALVSILTAGIVFRWRVIGRAIEYDEAYTYIEFARHSLKWVITTYYVANNHVFNTVMVHFSTAIFGNEVWAIRLPAFVMGIISILAGYLIAKKLYGKWVGLLAASLLAVLPAQILFTTRARGYSTVACMGLLALLSAIYARKHKNLFAWFSLAVTGAIGVYTIPVMIYPYGVAFTWLFLSGLRGKISKSYTKASWFTHMLVSGAGAVLLAVLAYSPILISYGIPYFVSIAGGSNSLSLNDFIVTLPDRLNEIYPEWTIGLINPAAFVTLTGIGIFLSFFYRSKWIKTSYVSVQGALTLFMMCFLLIQKPYILERIMLWMLPWLLIWSACGWWIVVEALNKRLLKPSAVVGLVSVALVLLLGAWYPATVDIYNIPYASSESRDISLTLKNYVTDKDVVIPGDYDAPYWYYFDYYQIPQSTIRNIKTRPFKYAYVIAGTKEPFDMMINNDDYINRVMLSGVPEEILRTPYTTVYRMPASVSAQSKAFPDKDLNYWD